IIRMTFPGLTKPWAEYKYGRPLVGHVNGRGLPFSARKSCNCIGNCRFKAYESTSAPSISPRRMEQASLPRALSIRSGPAGEAVDAGVFPHGLARSESLSGERGRVGWGVVTQPTKTRRAIKIETRTALNSWVQDSSEH